jgi:hypothetical protein
MEASVARRSRQDEKATPEGEVQGARLEPIRVVRRRLKRPDGTTLEVDVPVYPPFRLDPRPTPKAPPVRRARHTGDARKASDGSERGRS